MRTLPRRVILSLAAVLALSVFVAVFVLPHWLDRP